MSRTIECQATRRGRAWVVHVPEHGAYGHGRTLKLAGESVAQALALLGVTADIRLIPATPELESLRAVHETYLAALREAVGALALRRATAADIALATGAPLKQVRLLLAERAQDPAHPADPEHV